MNATTRNTSLTKLFLKVHEPSKNIRFEKLETLIDALPYSDKNISNILSMLVEIAKSKDSGKVPSHLIPLVIRFFWRSIQTGKNLKKAFSRLEKIKKTLRNALYDTCFKELLKAFCFLCFQVEVQASRNRSAPLLKHDRSGRIWVSLSASFQAYKGLFESFSSQFLIDPATKDLIGQSIHYLISCIEENNPITPIRIRIPKLPHNTLLEWVFESPLPEDFLKSVFRYMKAFLSLYNEALSITEMSRYSKEESHTLDIIIQVATIAAIAKACSVPGIQGCDEKITPTLIISPHIQSAAQELNELLKTRLVSKNSPFKKKILELIEIS